MGTPDQHLRLDKALALASVFEDSGIARKRTLRTSPRGPLFACFLVDAGSAGNLTTDAHLAALAIEHGAERCSTDTDFARFAHLRWQNPLA